MTFLAPFLAGFVALGSIPIIIHLLNRRRFRVVVWAAMEFLLATMQKNSRRLQLRDLILMLLRTAAIVLLALALARPTMGGNSWLGRDGDTAAVLVVDNSLSMGWKGGAESRFQLAQKRAQSAIEVLPKNSGAALLLVNDQVTAEIPEPSHDLGFVASTVAAASLSDGGTEAVPGLERAIDLLEKTPSAARELYLFSDMQAGAWPKADDERMARVVARLKAMKPAPRVFLVDCGDGGTENLAIEDLRLVDDIPTTDAPVTIETTVRRHGRGSTGNVSIDLFIAAGDGEPRKVAGQVIDSLEGSRVLRFQTRFTAGGDHRIEVRSSADRLDADNARFLATDVIDRIKVLVIDGQPAGPGESFGGETDFLMAALSPRDENGERRSLIDAERSTVFALQGKRLKDYRAVVLANVRDLPPDLVTGLKTYVHGEGGGLVAFLGDNVQAAIWNQLLFDQARLLPGRLGGVVDSGAGGIGLAVDELSHPIVGMFADKEAQPWLAAPRFNRFFTIEIPEGGEPGRAPDDRTHVVARFTTGQPAIVERATGHGGVVLAAFPADRAWSDFPLRAAYLPVVMRAVQYVSLGRQPPRTVKVHDRLLDILSAGRTGSVAMVQDPRGVKRAAASEQLGDLAYNSYARTDFAGFYRLDRGVDATGKPGASASRWYAANPPAGESSLEALGEGDLRKRLGGFPFTWIGAEADLRSKINQGRVGSELWPLLLALVLACLAAESILALRWAPKES